MDSRQDPGTILAPLTSRARHAHGVTTRADVVTRRALVAIVSCGVVAAVLSIAGPASIGGQIGEARRRRRRRHRRKRASQPTATTTPTPTPTSTPTPTPTPTP